MIPQPRLLWWAGLPAAGAAWTLLVSGSYGAIWAMDLAIVVMVAIDALRSRARWSVERHFGEVQSIGRAFPVSLRVLHGSKRSLAGRITDHAPGVKHGLPGALWIPPGTTGHLDYSVVVASRGEHAFGEVVVRWRSPWGLWEREQRIVSPDKVRVYPDLSPLRKMRLPGVPAGRRRGPQVRRRRGGESEFERLRPYVPGDSYRAIDWRATARRHELVAREYRQEVDQNVIFLLDSGRMASARVDALTAFDHSLNAALMLGHAALQRGDRVGLLAYDRHIRTWLPPRGGLRTGKRMTQATYDLFPTLEEADPVAAFRFLGERIRRRSLLVVMITGLDEGHAGSVDAWVGALARRHLVVCACLRHPALEAAVDPTQDPFVAGAAAEILSLRESALRRLRRRGALVVEAEPERLAQALVDRYLRIKAERLL